VKDERVYLGHIHDTIDDTKPKHPSARRRSLSSECRTPSSESSRSSARRSANLRRNESATAKIRWIQIASI